MPSTSRAARFAAMMSDVEKNYGATNPPITVREPDQSVQLHTVPLSSANVANIGSEEPAEPAGQIAQSDDWTKLDPVERFLRNIVVPQDNDAEHESAEIPHREWTVFNSGQASSSLSRAVRESSRGCPNDHKPVHEVKAPPVKTITEDTYKLDQRMGEVAPKGNYASFDAVVKYCYKFAPPEYLQPLATAFFDAEKVWNRKWDLYYIRSPLYPCDRATLFITERQLQDLIDECNEAFPGANLAVSDHERNQGLVQDFYFEEPYLRPHFLGHSNCKARTKFLEMEAPELSTAKETGHVNQDDIEAFKHKITLAQEAARINKKGRKAASKAQKDAQKRQMVNEHLRTQRYLGIIPKQDHTSMPDIASMSLSELDITQPAPHPFDNDVVFISVDCEAWEHNPSCVTEVGIATLDTRDLVGIAPGRVGENWFAKIRARHFRILEHKGRVNRDYVAGCPDHFDFGQSEFVSEAKISSTLTSCFHEPFSKCDVDGAMLQQTEDTVPPRNIVLVGHDLNQDIDYCRKLGFSVLNRGNLLDRVDTASLYRTYTRDPNPRALGTILCDFDLVCWHLHNAGNDAVCTLWALLAVAVSHAAERGTGKEDQRHEANLASRLEGAKETALERVYEDAGGWAMSRDGGEPILDGDESVTGSRSNRGTGRKKPVFGPERPPAIPEGHNGLYTMGGVPLDI